MPKKSARLATPVIVVPSTVRENVDEVDVQFRNNLGYISIRIRAVPLTTKE